MMRKGYVDIPAGQVHFRSVDGADAAPIAFLHQTASSSKMWEGVMNTLRHNTDHPLFAFDTPGFGGSFDPVGDTTIGDYVSWLIQCLEELRIDHCHVVGHHTGSCIGCQLAASHPERVLSLTMIGPVPLTAEERLEFSKNFGVPFTPDADGSYLSQNYEYLKNLGATRDPSLLNREMSDQLRAWKGRVQSYSAVWDQNFVEHFERVSAPIMLMCAQDDVLWPFFERAKDIRPDAQTHPVSGANFEPDFDPESVARAIEVNISNV